MRRLGIALAACLVLTPPAQAQRNRIQALEIGVRSDSLDPFAHFELAVALLDDRQHDRADTVLRAALALAPQLAEAQLAWAVAQDRNRRYWERLRRTGGDSAMGAERAARDAALRRAFLLDPFVDVRLLAHGDERRGIRDPTPYGSYGLLFMFLDVDFQAHLRRRGVADSLPPGLLWLHGLAAGHVRRYDVAIRDLTTLVRVMTAREQGDSVQQVPLPTNEVRYVLAAVQQRAGNATTAFALYREVLEYDVGNYMAHVQLARIHEAREEWSQAIRARRAAAALVPEDASLLRDLGGALARGRFLPQADSALMAAHALNPRDPLTTYQLGVVRQQLGRNAEARGAFERFVATAPMRYAAAVEDARARLAHLPK